MCAAYAGRADINVEDVEDVDAADLREHLLLPPLREDLAVIFSPQQNRRSQPHRPQILVAIAQESFPGRKALLLNPNCDLAESALSEYAQ